MKIVLAGPPDSGKQNLGMEFLKKKQIKEVTFPPEDSLKVVGLDSTLGLLSDYRTELFLCSYRAQRQILEEDTLFTHSPIDSYAHVVARISQLEEVHIDTEPWVWTLMACGQMLMDSMKYDVIYRVTKDDIDNEFDRLVDTAMDEILNELKFPYTTIQNA